jgi:hypothetical protein
MRPDESSSPKERVGQSAEHPPIKMPNPPEDKQPEIPKVGSRDAPGG